MSDQVILGGRQLDELLRTLPVKVERNIMRAALRAGAGVIRNAAKEKVPVRLGELRKSIKVTAGVNGGVVTAKVATRLWYAHFVEFGTAMHWVHVKKEERPWRNTRRGPKALSMRTLNRMTKRGSLKIGTHFVGNSIEHPGAKANPFMRPAFDENVEAAIAAVAAKVRERLTAEGINTPAAEVE